MNQQETGRPAAGPGLHQVPTNAGGQMTESSYHYNVIARAIKHIDQAGNRELSLDELAGRMGMSPSHFQRVFSQWVGVSPKRFQQYLSLQHAKRMLSGSVTVQHASNSLGLSGSGRLHDLFVTWEAMSPGEFARKGSGLTICWGWFDSPFGDLLAMGTDRGLCGLAFAAEHGREPVLADLCRRWPRASYTQSSAAIQPWVDAALRQRGEARLFMVGAPFQIKVWEALMAVPPGHVTTYSQIAAAAGAPTATRAAGTAVGRNPVSWLIPCHRVIRKSGGLGGYHWGLPVKRALLAWEAARSEA